MSLFGRTLFIDSTDCPTELCRIGGNFDTDKSPFSVNSACSKHRKGYTAIYQMLFSTFKHRLVRIAEIGIEAGASLRMWSKFFSSEARIHVFEKNTQFIDDAKKFNLPNVTFVHTDVDNIQYLDNSFQTTRVSFDIIIDDSTHHIPHQNNIINTVSKYLKSGGMLIIEDIDRDTPLSYYKIDPAIWEFHTFIICHHSNRNCYNNDKLLYLVKK